MPDPTAVSGTAPARSDVAVERGLDGWGWLVLPGVLFLGLVFFVPVLGMVSRSVTDPSPANYLKISSDSLVWRSLVYTLRIAVTVTFICLVIGYAWAYIMNKAHPTLQIVMAALIMVPFWSSLLVRTYAWTVILRESGIANQLLTRLGVISEPLELMGNTLGTLVGMTQILLPFMVLPLYAAMRQIDAELVPAAESLGANPAVAFVRVFVPLSLPGVMAGCLLVFVISLGFYITPAILGNMRQPMFSQLIVMQSQVLFHPGVASALAVTLLVLTLMLIWMGTRVVRIERVLGIGDGG
jgi:putative spermidine/putrescine transport system permease protein